MLLNTYLCQTKKKYYDTKAADRLLNNIENAKVTVNIAENFIYGPKRPVYLASFEINNQDVRSFFTKLVKLNVSMYIHFFSSFDNDEGLIGPKNNNIKSSSIEVIKDSVTGEVIAFFELEKDLHLDSINSLQVYGFKTKCPVIAKSFLLDLINKSKKSFSSFSGASYPLYELNRLANFIQKENSDFFVIPSSIEAFYTIRVKIAGPNHINIIFLSDELNNNFDNLTCDFSKNANMSQLMKKYEGKIKVIDDEIISSDPRTGEEGSGIYSVLIQLISYYLEQDKLNFLASKDFANYLQFQRPSSKMKLQLVKISEKKLLRSKKIIHRLLSRILEKCFPDPYEQCSQLGSFRGRATILILELDPYGRIEFSFCLDEPLTLSRRRRCLFDFRLERAEGKVDAKLVIPGDAILNNFYIINSNINDFVHDFMQILKLLGIITRPEDFDFLKKLCKYYGLI